MVGILIMKYVPAILLSLRTASGLKCEWFLMITSQVVVTPCGPLRVDAVNALVIYYVEVFRAVAGDF